MKTRTSYKKHIRHRKGKTHKKNLRKYKKGGQPQLNYSIPTKPVISSQQTDYVEESKTEQPQPISQRPMQMQIQDEPYDVAADAGKKVSDAVNKLKTIFNNAAQQVKDTYNKAKNKTLEQLSKVAETTQTAAQNATEKIKAARETATSALPLNTTSGGRKRKNIHSNKTRKNKNFKKFPKHKNLNFYF